MVSRINKNTTMKPFPFILISMIVGSLAVRAEIPAGWSTNFAATMASAEAAQQPVLVFFTAGWCGPCKLMARLTLTDPTIVAAISSVEHVAIDIDEHPDLATKHHVNAVPTFMMLLTADDELIRATGFQPVADFLPWLTNGISGARTALTRQAFAKSELSEVDQWLGSTETNALHLAALKIFDLCDLRDSVVVQASAARLKTIAARDPAVLVDGLNDPRLATRIQVANALRSVMGESFRFDPWSDAVTRGKEVSSLRQQIARPH